MRGEEERRRGETGHVDTTLHTDSHAHAPFGLLAAFLDVEAPGPAPGLAQAWVKEAGCALTCARNCTCG